MSIDWKNRPTKLYRLFNEMGELLYVGITYVWENRAIAHKNDKDWWPEVASVDIIEYPTRIEAALAERQAITTEKPFYNRMLHPDWTIEKGIRIKQLYGGLSPTQVADLVEEIKDLGLSREDAEVVIHEAMSRPIPRTITRAELDEAKAHQAKRNARVLDT